MSAIAEYCDDESLDEVYDIVACDICGEEGLNSDEHTWHDQREFRERTKHSVPMVSAADTTDNGHCYICENCREDYTYVVDTEALCPNADVVYVADIGDYYTHRYACENFYYDDNSDGWTSTPPEPEYGCLDYSSRVTDYFTPHLPFAKRLVMGVELEVEPTGRTAGHELVEAIDGPVGQNFICTDDASLNDGLEVNCMPFTLEEHKSDKYMPWSKVLETLRAGGGKSGKGTTACGMHVHINRRALTPLQIGKMLVFINSKRNDVKLLKIFQRGDNKYSHSAVKCILDGKKQYGDRGERINLNPDHTIEVRAFKGNLRYERVMKNIEFVHAMCVYCRDCSMQTVEDWDSFKRFVASRKSIYNNLHAYMIERGI